MNPVGGGLEDTFEFWLVARKCGTWNFKKLEDANDTIPQHPKEDQSRPCEFHYYGSPTLSTLPSPLEGI